MVRLNRVSKGLPVTILAKIEGRNPANSVKCRVGSALVRDAEERKVLKPGVRIIEPTSGNTGIALAFVAASRGYQLTLTMPDNMSHERIRLLEYLGAETILTDASKYMQGSIEAAQELCAKYPGKYFMPMQFDNPANPKVHEETTGPEIWEDTQGEIDILVAGIGTGGTITGVSRYIKQRQGRPILSVGVEPESSPVITQTLKKKKIKAQFHNIQGIGAGFVPANLDLSVLDKVELVSEEDSIEMSRRLAREEGILCGISCGAATVAALRLAALRENEGKVFVVIFPDMAERYLSTDLFSCC